MDIIRRKLRENTEMNEEKRKRRVLNRQVHMANERTFLAWIRTGIGVMAFGFVVVKYALFVRQMSNIIDKSTSAVIFPASHGYSAFLGVLLVALGAIMCFLGYIRYKKVEKQIDEETFIPTSVLDVLLTLSVLAVGIFLVIYLIYSI
ncbi:MAG TPA: DUF202 domain-containing protein [Bacteroidales bacterium]|nr:DUF202 domain-containing protein [Bacteroidales bacterium]